MCNITTYIILHPGFYLPYQDHFPHVTETMGMSKFDYTFPKWWP